ncbi:MAG: Rrf2 family transcriptional regulator [Chthoniobacterales bacterium]|jgi:Rrf2 family protein|nr:Rrf2 family transcriptional regulator [Chthoniobacterales bacterium]
MVNQQFTFAVHILTALAFAGEKMDSQRLAASVNTNPVVIRRLLIGLRRAHLIETCAGKHGGTRLSKKPAQISLLQVYDAVQPRPVIAINKRKVLRHCRVSCKMREIMSGVAAGTEEAVRQHLREITLQQLLREVRRPA